MQTLEAIISFTVFMIFASYVLLQLGDYSGVDDSLYRYQLANDVWRVLYLQGAFRDLDSLSGIDENIGSMMEETGFCIYIRGQQATAPSIRGTGCRAGEPLAKVQHVLIVNGKPEKVTLSLYQPEY